MPFDWFAWWNAIYTVPLAVVLAFLAVTSVMSLLGGAGAWLDSAAHSSHGGHDAAVEAHTGHTAEGGSAAHSDDGHDLLLATLSALGVGKAPLGMVLQVLFLLWGLVGIVLHHLAAAAGPLALVWSVPVTLAASAVGTRAFAQVFGRYLKQYETAAVRRDHMVGKMGTVVYPVTDDAGTVNVRDEHGTLHRIRARTRHGALDSGRQVIVVGYDSGGNTYEVDDAASFTERP